MTGAARSERPRIVVVGAGVAALEFLLALAELAPERAAVTLVAPDATFDYMPFAVAQAFDAGDAFALALDRVTAHAGARQLHTRVASVDRRSRVVFTARGEAVPYDVLVVAPGARADPAVPGALTFKGPRGAQSVRALLAELDAGSVSSVAFVAPPGPSWTLPLYELALLSAAHLVQRGRTGRIVLVIPDAAPLELFGEAASGAVAELLDEARIEVHCGHHAIGVVDGRLRLAPEQTLKVDRVVALPRLRGPNLAGIPSTEGGFIPTDDHGRVDGTDDVYAAGDATAFAVKHGGVSIDQATAVAEVVAARLGVALRPRPFRPVLRGLLLTGAAPRFLWSDLTGGPGEASAVAAHPLWWPPGKIAGGRLAAFLHAEGLPVPLPPAGPATTPAELEPRDERRILSPVRPA